MTDTTPFEDTTRSNDEPPLGCPFPNCSATFRSIDAADQHVETAHADDDLDEQL